MEFKLIEYNSVEYIEMVELRNRVLLEPINIPYAEGAFADDEKDNTLLLGLFTKDMNDIVACCLLTSLSEDTVRLRQMAVDPDFERKGLGSKLLSYADEVAKEEGFAVVMLHARKSAHGFYLRYGYTDVGEEFEEVGIPHIKMIKDVVNQIDHGK